jgi:hypothetical protein
LVGFVNKDSNWEIIFTVIFSALVFVLFFSLLGANGLIIGNDPAVHVTTAQKFLTTGKIPISDIAWYPPLYHIILGTFMAFSGMPNVGELLILVKALTALVDWLLIFSVYLITAKFFSKKTGGLAATLMLLCFPLFEVNAWGGYTTILSLSFMMLAFMFLAQPIKNKGTTLIAFTLAFCVVLSHQLATFLAVFILPPFVLVVLIRSKGNYPKALIAALLGGAIAFGIYYLRPILPYLGDLVYIVFFQLQTMLYQVPAVSAQAFLVNFGFVLFFAFAGLVIGFFKLKRKKMLSFYLLLTMAFLVPLLFSQTYLIGVYLPYQRFLYFMLPPMVVLAAVSFSFIIDALLASYFNNRKGWKRNVLKVVSVAAVCVLVAVMAVRVQTVMGKIEESTKFYSGSDFSAYNAGLWIRNNCPEPKTAVVTQQPGHWFGVYSGQQIIAQTDPVVEWNSKAESVLSLSYEMENPLTMVRTYHSTHNASEEEYVSLNMVWRRVAFAPLDDAYVAYRGQNETLHTFKLSSLNRSFTMNEVDYPQKITIKYSAEEFSLKQSIFVSNQSFPITVTWELTALSNLSFATLYIGEYFDAAFSFNKVYVPGVLNWANPWDNASKVESDRWAVTDFKRENLIAEKYINFVDEKNQVAYGIKFVDLPDSGNIGALSNKQIDAIRFIYNFYKIEANYTISTTYQILAFSQSSYPQLENLEQASSLFDIKTEEQFEVKTRNFASLIRDNNVGFIVYDVKLLDQSILNSEWLELVYANDKFAVCKINPNHPYVVILEKPKP